MTPFSMYFNEDINETERLISEEVVSIRNEAEQVIDCNYFAGDPFNIIAAREEALGCPLALH